MPIFLSQGQMNKAKQIPKLKRKLLKLWSKKIHELYSNKCAICGKEGKLDAHHIEDKSCNYLRYDLNNGVLLCPSHHKFGHNSAHKSPIFFISWLIENERDKWIYLSKYRNEKLEFTIEKLEEIERALGG